MVGGWVGDGGWLEGGLVMVDGWKVDWWWWMVGGWIDGGGWLKGGLVDGWRVVW